MRRHLLIPLLIGGLLLHTPLSYGNSVCPPPNQLQQLLKTLSQTHGTSFKKWAKTHDEALQKLFQLAAGDEDFFRQHAVSTYESSSASQKRGRLIFATKLVGLAITLYGAAYIDSAFIPEGPMKFLWGATLVALLISLVHPLLGPVVESLFKNARIDSFRSMTGMITPVNPKLITTLSRFYKRTHSVFDMWTVWSRDDMALMLIRLQQYLNLAMQFYGHYKLLTPEQIQAKHHFSNPQVFHDPLAQALIAFAELYPDYASEPGLMFRLILDSMFRSSYFDNRDLDVDLLRTSLRHLDPDVTSERARVYEQAIQYIQRTIAPTPEPRPSN